MRLKQITIEGFKSYAQKREINDCDEHFNCIIGKNGSGKSNLFDAICFCMGMKKQQRTENNFDYLFEKGERGIKKATVCLLFVNDKKSPVPPAYQNYQEILVQRTLHNTNGKQFQDVFYIAGKKANMTQVKNFFSDIGMNPDIHNFIVYQNDVTSFNHSAKQLLEKIEEASGTSQYEKKKNDCQRTITKKEADLVEIRDQMNDIKQKMEQFQEMKELQEKSSDDQKRLAVLKMNLIYINFWETIQDIKQKKMNLLNLEDSKVNIIHEKNQTEEQIQELQMKIDKLQQQNDEQALMQAKNEFEKNEDDIQDIQENLKQLQLDLNKLKELKQSDKSNFQTFQQDIENINKQVQIEKINEASHKQNMLTIDQRLDELKLTLLNLQNQDEEQLKQQNIKNIKQQLEDIEDTLNQEKEQKQILLAKLENQKNLMLQCKQQMGEYQDLNQFQIKVQEITKQFESIELHIQQQENQKQQQVKEQQNLSQMQQKCQFLENELNKSFKKTDKFFFYNALENKIQNFKSVYGRIAQFVTIKDNKYATALVAALGESFFTAIIVQNGETGSEIIQKKVFQGNLKLFVLDQIKLSNSVDHQQILNNFRGKNFVISAADLVSCSDEKLQPIVEQQLRNVFITDNDEVASQIQDRGRLAVTLDGKVFRSNGTVTGGSYSLSNNIILIFQEQQQRIKEYLALRNQILQLNQNVGRNSTLNIEGLYQKRFEVQNILEEFQNGNISKSIRQYEVLEKEVQTVQLKVQQSDNNLKNLENRCQDYTQKLQQLKKSGGSLEQQTKHEIKEKEEQREKEQTLINQCCKKITTLESQLKNRENELRQIQEDFEQNEIKMKQKQEEFYQYEQSLNCALEQKVILEQKHKKINQTLNECGNQRETFRKKIIEQKDKIYQLEKDLENSGQIQERIKNELKEKDAQLEKCKRENKDLYNDNDEARFIQRRNQQDFQKDYLKDNIKELEKKQNKAKQKINQKALNNLAILQEEFKDLQLKQNSCENDKQKLQLIFQETEEKRNDQIKLTLQTINTVMNSILSHFLKNWSITIDWVDEED